MGISLRPIDHDEVFHYRTSREPIIVNDLPDTTTEEKKYVDNLIFTRYDLIHSDLLSNIPSCACGNTLGVDKLGNGHDIRAVVCPDCHTEVTAPYQGDLEPLIWMRSPKGVKALIKPRVLTMLSEHFQKNSFDVIRWICDRTYKAPVKEPPVMEAIRAAGLPRGYNHFVDNFDAIMAFLFNLKFYPKKELAPLREFITRYRHVIFSQYLPLPNRSLLVLEETNHAAYTDCTAPIAIDAIRMMVGIDSPAAVYSDIVRENRTIRMLFQTAGYYDITLREFLASKSGVFRKNVFGTRCHFAFRAVISSNTCPHDYSEVHIPWSVGVVVFELHLKNFLMREGMTPWEAETYLNAHVNQYSEKLDRYFNRIIEESPWPGVPVTVQRNPSLHRASIQLLFITRVTRDVAQPTVVFSILDVTGPNADYDGDMMNLVLPIDHVLTRELYPLMPHQSAFSMNEPRALSKNLSMPKTVVLTISNWMHWPVSELDPPEPEVLQRMALIPEAA
jgi:RNA polymerase Rpb1, domain 2